ncbi:MAG: DUF2723 domain-containing protein [Polyangia bacterium]
MSPAALTFVLTACAYALGLCPSLYWLDSGELAGAGFELGIAHAPGQPLAVLVEKLFMLLPLGDVSLRAGLSQLVCGAAAASVVTWLGERIARRFVQGRSAAVLGIAAGLLWASSYAAAFQAVRPEVYALSALMVLGTIALCVRYTETGEPRWLAWAGLCFGLGLTDHHYLVLVGAAPPALALIVPEHARPGFWKALARAALATALGLCVYLYLPLRAAHDPIFDWGHPTTLANFFWVVSAQSFQKSASGGAHGDATLLVGALLDQLTPVALFLALGGLYLCARRFPRLAVVLALMLFGPVFGRLFVTFDSGNPDAFAYLGTGVAALALLCVPLVAVAAHLAKARGTVIAGAALALVGVRAAWVAPSLSLARFDDARAILAPLLDESPPHAVVITSYFQTTFAFDYLRVVEGARPDLTFVPRHFLVQPGVRASLLRRDPSLSPLLGARDIVPEAVRTSARPIVLEYDLDLDYTLCGKAATVPTFGTYTELQTRRYAVWQAVLHLDQLCRMGAPPTSLSEAMTQLRRRAASPDDAFVSSLVDRCPTERGH